VTLPLSGRSVVVTRTRSQSSELVERLARLGADVVELPVIAVEEPDDGGAALAEAVGRLVSGGYAWVAVTSPNAVSRLLAAIGDETVPGAVRWAAVGAGTARSLQEGGLRVDLVPGRAVSEALAEAFPAADPGSEGDGAGSVLLPRAETVRGALAPTLRAKGWLVDEVVAYRTVAGRPDAEAVAAAQTADAIAFTSSSTVERTAELLGPTGLPEVVISIGPVTTGSARSLGLEVAAEAEPHTIDGLVEAVVAALGDSPAAPGGHSPVATP
jgi:uroporphyrinogen III methyltransferase/synthase